MDKHKLNATNCNNTKNLNAKLPTTVIQPQWQHPKV